MQLEPVSADEPVCCDYCGLAIEVDDQDCVALEIAQALSVGPIDVQVENRSAVISVYSE